MPVASGFFANAYSFEIADMPAEHDGLAEVIEANAVAVIEYVSDFVAWEGTLDFVARFGSPTMFGFPGTGLLPAYGRIGPDGRTFAHAEALTGEDANGADWDLGAWILPDREGRLVNYGTPLWFDPTPDPYEAPQVPPGTADFFSIYLHEVMHGLGIWSFGQTGPEAVTALDRLSVAGDGQSIFEGPETVALLGEPLPWSALEDGTRDHYGRPADGSAGPVSRGLMWEFGNYERNRWHLGQLDLAILADLGHIVANADVLDLVEVPDRFYMGRPPGAPQNAAPLAGDDAVMTVEGAPVRIPAATLLANDTDPDGDALAILSVGAPGSGTAVLGADGSLSYVPAPGYIGTDSFVYAVADPGGAQDTAVVTVTVTPRPPNEPITGTPGDDTLADAAGDDRIDGGAGRDTVVYAVGRGAAEVSAGSEAVTVALAGETDTLLSIERIAFADGTLVLDLAADAALAYRLYAAALARTPDEAGLRFWAEAVEAGLSRRDLAEAFAASDEFAAIFLADPTDPAFVEALYANVLGRGAADDPAGRDYWLSAFETGRLDRADMLIAFADSAENRAATAPDIEEGFWTL